VTVQQAYDSMQLALCCHTNQIIKFKAIL